MKTNNTKIYDYLFSILDTKYIKTFKFSGDKIYAILDIDKLPRPDFEYEFRGGISEFLAIKDCYEMDNDVEASLIIQDKNIDITWETHAVNHIVFDMFTDYIDNLKCFEFNRYYAVQQMYNRFIVNVQQLILLLLQKKVSNSNPKGKFVSDFIQGDTYFQNRVHNGNELFYVLGNWQKRMNNNQVVEWADISNNGVYIAINQ